MKILPVFAAFLMTIYGNFAAPTDVMQVELTNLLPPRLNEMYDQNFEGEGVRDRNQGDKKVESERIEIKNDEIRSSGNSENAEKEIKINFYEFKTFPNGNYHFEYHQSDLQHREEFGVFDHDPITNDRIFTVNGSYEFIRPDGKRQIVEYTAGKDGFKPKVTVH